MNKEMMLLGTSDEPLVIPEGIDFSSNNDVLYRTSDLVGNSNSKTVTMSFWSYYPTNGGFRGIVGAGSGFLAFMAGATTFRFLGRNASGSNVLNFDTVGSAGDFKLMPVRKWNNIIISFDLSDTLKRHVFINDIDVTNDITWAAYVDDEIRFQQSNWAVGALGGPSSAYKGRLCNMFLDYTYRDLTVESNRRLFVNSVDSGTRIEPAPFNTMEALNPILFMPMKNGPTATDNFGTGGNFLTDSASFTSQRGPNQLNCSACLFDGSNQGLADSTGNGGGNTFNFTMVANIFRNGLPSGAGKIIQAKILATGQETHSLEITGANNNVPGVLVFSASNVSGGFNSFINGTLPADDLFPPNTHNQVVISATDPNPPFGSFTTFHLFVNGVDKTSLVTRLGNGARFSRPSLYTVGQQDGGGNEFTGTLGEVFFSSSRHWDLPNDNPFWDYENDLPRSLRDANAENIRNTNQPLTGEIQCPIDASDPGKNNGSASDFTVETNSAGIAAMSGARGMSEYWAKSADFSDISSTFEKTSPAGIGATKTLTYVAYFRHTSTLGTKALIAAAALSSGSGMFSVFIQSNSITVEGFDTNNNKILSLIKSCVIDQSTWHSIMLCVDMTDTTKTKLYLDSFELTGGTHVVTDDNIDLSLCKFELGGLGGFNNYPGNIGFVYFDDSYTDLTTRAGRNLFIDPLGFPVNLSKSIADGTISDPSMRFEFKNQALIGKNSGTGGDFSTNLMTQGADVYPNEF